MIFFGYIILISVFAILSYFVWYFLNDSLCQFCGYLLSFSISTLIAEHVYNYFDRRNKK